MAITRKKSTGSANGKTPAKRKIMLTLEAPGACDVYVAGDFNDWDRTSHPLQCNAKGVWNTRLALAPGRYEYRFLADGEWRDDPGCTVFVPNAFGSYNSAIVLE